MQSIRLVPEDKGNIIITNKKIEDLVNAYSFIERDASNDYHGDTMSCFGFLDDKVWRCEEW